MPYGIRIILLLRFASIGLVTIVLAISTAAARPRPPLPPPFEPFLQLWRFDYPQSLDIAIAEGVFADNVNAVESWSGYAVELSGLKPAFLRLATLDIDGRPNVTCDTGSIRFWFSPLWTSQSLGGTGPATPARLLEIGQWSKDAAQGWWSLWCDPGGDAIYFSTQADGKGADYLKAPISWRADEWHLLTLSYSPKGTELYIDGALASAGGGLDIIPNEKIIANGLALGCDADGQNLAQGLFDEVTTFDEPRDPRMTAAYYRFLGPWSRLGPLTTKGVTGPRVVQTGTTDPTLRSANEAPFGLTDPPEGGPQLRNGPMNNNLQGSNCLWLEIALTPTNLALLTLHGTTPGTNYLILSSTHLPTSNWAVETWLYTTNEQDYIETLVPLDRPAVFYRGGIGEDTDGDGLPDVYEDLVTGTDPNSPDTGDTGTSDGYKDSDGDGWTNLQEMQNGTSPSVANSRPPPRNVRATIASDGVTVTLKWEASHPGTVNYVVRRSHYGEPDSEIGQPTTELLTFTDSGLAEERIGYDANSYYAVKAVYANGESEWSEWAPARRNDLTTPAAIVRGRGGRIKLVVSALPSEAERLHVSWNRWVDPDVFVESLDVPVTNLVNGVYDFTDSEAAQFQETDDFSGHYYLYPLVQVRCADGAMGDYYLNYDTWQDLSVFGDTINHFVDASEHIAQNARFLMRSAYRNKPFGYNPSLGISGTTTRGAYGSGPDRPYEFVGYYWNAWTTAHHFNELAPLWENAIWRNFFYDTSDFNGVTWLTGAFYVPSFCPGFRSAANPRYYFDYATPQPYTNIPPARLVNQAHTWTLYGLPFLACEPAEQPMSAVLNGQTYSVTLEPGMTNYFGLPFVSSRIAYANTSPSQFPTLSPGQTAQLTNSVVGLFHEAADPVLITVKYVFLDRYAAMPGHPGFSEDGLPQPFVLGMGRALQLAAWAKQVALNGDTNKPIYVSQYFDKAYKVDSYGYVTTNETGIPSEYGEFFSTEAGRVILTTKPDAVQGGIQGTALVHVISLNVDANHDSLMDRSWTGKDQTSPGRPMVFWVNDDWDGSYDPGNAWSTEKAANPKNTDVSGIYASGLDKARDLEDCARLWISGLPDFSQVTGWSAELTMIPSAGAPAINLYRAFEEDGGTLYLSDSLVASNQIYRYAGPGGYAYGSALAQIASGSPYQINLAALGAGRQHFLFEVVSAGTGELVLSIRKNGIVQAETSVHFRFQPPRELYEQVAVVNVLDDPTAVEQNGPGYKSKWSTSHLPRENAATSDEVIVFVHGWNMSEWNYHNFSETMFKRLHWQGYQGRFVALRWPTFNSDDFPTFGSIKAIFTYNQSEYRAYRSGHGAADYFDRLRQRYPDHLIGVCAHSMGGVVMAETLKILAARNSQPIDNLVLMQAAMSAHSYNPLLPDYGPLANPDLQPAADVYRGYAVGTGGALAGRLVNFYNANDFALATGTVGPIEANWEYNQRAKKPVLVASTNNSPIGMSIVRFDRYGLQQGGQPARILEEQISIGGQPTQYITNLLSLRALTDPREIAAYASRSRSKAVGAFAGVGGQVEAEVNLGVDGGVIDLDRARNEHSGQFNLNADRTRQFYRQLMIALGMRLPDQP